MVEGVTALLRRNGLAEQAWEEVGSPKKGRRRAAGRTAPKSRRRAADCTAHNPGPPLKPRKTQPGLHRKAATARVGWVGPTRRLRARAPARWVRMQESRRGLEVGRAEEMTFKRRFSDTKFCLQNPPSEHRRFTSSLPREWALARPWARPRAKVGPWGVVDGVTALLRLCGLPTKEGPCARRRRGPPTTTTVRL